MIILTYMNRINIYTIGNEEITNLVNKFINFILYNNEYGYYYFEYKKFKDCYISYYYHSKLFSVSYNNYSGKDHREDGPAYIKYNKNDEISKKEYYLNGIEYSYEEYLLEFKK